MKEKDQVKTQKLPQLMLYCHNQEVIKELILIWHLNSWGSINRFKDKQVLLILIYDDAAVYHS
jgi:hypothetical protein